MQQCKGKKYWWRGQSAEKPLLPSIYRDSKLSSGVVEEHLRRFRGMEVVGELKQIIDKAKQDKPLEYNEALNKYRRMIDPKGYIDNAVGI